MTQRVPADEELFPGTVVQVGDDGIARRVPWTESMTAYGPTGKSPIKRNKHAPGRIEKTPLVKRTDRTRAEVLAESFTKQLDQMAKAVGRPLEPSDLSEEWLRTFGLEFWKTGQPITNEHLRRIAGTYLEAAKRGAARDPRFVPGPA